MSRYPPPPPHPGNCILEHYLDAGLTTLDPLASNLGISGTALQAILATQMGVTPQLASKLSQILGRSSDDWLSMQDEYDEWRAKAYLKKIRARSSSH